MNGSIFIPLILFGMFWLGWKYGHYLFGRDRRGWLRRTENRYHL